MGDLAGRTTGITDAGGTTSFAYDYEDRIVSISRPGTTTNTFAYNGFGARVSKSDSLGTTTYLRSGTSVVAPVVSLSGAESATFTPGISERRGTDSRFYHGDIKNFVEQTDSAGQIVSSQQYDAFGNLVSSSGTWSGPFAYGGRFGYQSDADYGLHLLGHRYYDPTTGRFLSRDPIKDGRNWYAYCDNRSVHLADPWGLVMMSVVLGMSGFGPPRVREQRKAVVVFGGVPWWDRVATAAYRHWWSSFFVDQWRKAGYDVIVFDGDHTKIDKARLLGELAEADLFYGHGHGGSQGLELAPHGTTDDEFLFPDDWEDVAEARRRAGRGKAAAAVLDWCGSSGCTYAVSEWADQVFASKGSTGVWDLISGRKTYVQSPEDVSRCATLR